MSLLIFCIEYRYSGGGGVEVEDWGYVVGIEIYICIHIQDISNLYYRGGNGGKDNKHDLLEMFLYGL